MGKLECEIEGLDDLESKWNRAVDVLEVGVQNAAPIAVAVGLTESRAANRYRNQSGRLTESARITVNFQFLGGSEAELDWLAPYAKYVEYGTKAHWIRPKAGFGTPKRKLLPGQTARSEDDIGTHRVKLRWWSGGRYGVGYPIFAREVWHPGTQPTGFANVGRIYSKLVAQREVDRAIAAAIGVMTS